MPIYARVEKGVITEYPVYDTHIVNRGEDFSLYTLCEDPGMPAQEAGYDITEDVKLVGDKVIISYNKNPQSLDTILSILYSKQPQDPDNLDQKLPIHYSEVPADLFARIRSLAQDLVISKLDEVAQQHNYFTIYSAISWISSTDPNHSSDAAIANRLRDAVRTNLEGYLGELIAGTKPIPASSADILTVMPDLTWV